MAEFIQSEVRLIHSIESNKPTDEKSSTEPNDEKGIDEPITPTAKGKSDPNDFIKGFMKASAYRRMANTTISQIEFQITRYNDSRIFQQSLIGNTRSMQKLQNRKIHQTAATNFTKGFASALISSYAINPAIGALFAIDTALGALNKVTLHNDNMNQEVQRRQVEMYVGRNRRDRTIVNTYNRR